LVSPPILIYPVPGKQFILDTDASNFAVGAVLSQTATILSESVCTPSSETTWPKNLTDFWNIIHFDGFNFRLTSLSLMKEKTAFSTTQGLFHFTVTPFGLANSPSTFERLMEDVLRGLPWEECQFSLYLFFLMVVV
jgi:hypothetical protein